MLNRKIFSRLKTWYHGDRKKAPLLDGARQVGKTTTIREFAKRHYKRKPEKGKPNVFSLSDGGLQRNAVINE